MSRRDSISFSSSPGPSGSALFGGIDEARLPLITLSEFLGPLSETTFMIQECHVSVITLEDLHRREKAHKSSMNNEIRNGQEAG